jgi:hypothetical protein
MKSARSSKSFISGTVNGSSLVSDDLPPPIGALFGERGDRRDVPRFSRPRPAPRSHAFQIYICRLSSNFPSSSPSTRSSLAYNQAR